MHQYICPCRGKWEFYLNEIHVHALVKKVQYLYLHITCINFLVFVVDSMFLDLSVSASCPANMHATKRSIYGIADKAPF